MQPSPETPPAPGAGVALSVVINNYNYARYLPETIGSVLAQGEEVAEILVVDDCSTDNSRDVIDEFAQRFPGRVRGVYQPVNSGQGAAFNAGHAAARGDMVMFLDADDFMLPGAAAKIRANYEPEVTLYHYRMRYTDETSKLGDGVFPPLSERLADGLEASEKLRSVGRYPSTITSGLVFNRWVLDRMMPVDAEAFRYGGDGYVVAAGPLYGPVRSFETETCAYRLHGGQHTSRRAAQAKLARWRIDHDHQRYRVIREHSARLGLPVAVDLGTRDDGHLFERIVSLVFEPEAHPIEGDTLGRLIRDIKPLEAANRRGLRRAFSGVFWTAMQVAPRPLKLQLMRLRLDPNSRPAWVRKLARTVRRRFRV
ncbi:glycosyltransferase family 2 protein [Hyphomonas sp.]|uniref:glycosyltransferase family 2 protein n=1 Tax=Hyphomonas sp. TaxID=87 RepID=UPI00391D7B38